MGDAGQPSTSGTDVKSVLDHVNTPNPVKDTPPRPVNASTRSLASPSASSFTNTPSHAASPSPSRDTRPARLLSRKTSKDQVLTTKTGQDASQATIDPLSRHILKRTNTQNLIPPSLMTSPTNDQNTGTGEALSGRTLINSPTEASITRTDSLARSVSAQKDKKKGVSFLSRIIGTKKKDASSDIRDGASEVSENRPTGLDAEIFSQPIGYIPRFPPPPKYIKVKSMYTYKREFDRVFLAQMLNNREVSKRKKSTEAGRTSISSTPSVQNPGNTNAIWAMEFSKDGKYLATAGQDRVVRIWAVISSHEDRQVHEQEEEIIDGQEEGRKLNAPVFMKKLIREYRDHESSVLDLSWSKNNFLLSSSMDKTVRLWHVSRDQCLCTFKHPDFVTSIQFHPRDDRFFLAGSLDSKVRLWSIPDKEVAYSAHVQNMVTAVAFTPDGKHAIAGCYDGICLIYETDKLVLHAQIHVRSARGKNAKGSKITGIETMALPKGSPNAETKLLITSNDSRVRMYNFRDRQLEIKFRGNENTCSQIHATFSDDGRHVICGSEDRKVYIWPTGPVDKELEKRPVHVFEAHSAIVTTAIFAPTRAKQLLGESGDPIYDLVNPPPVTLVERTDSVHSSKAPTESGRSAKSKHDSENPLPSRVAERPKRPEVTFPDGNIIISADYTGAIKVFRQDCAFEKRQLLSWDTQSTFSKKILRRSGSVATRTSIGSSTHRHNSLSRNSMVLPKTNNDRILNWRNSIATNKTPSHETLQSRRSENPRTRSVSPGKSTADRRAGGHDSPSPRASDIITPSIVTNSPTQSSEKPPSESADLGRNPPQEAYDPVPHDRDDPLMLLGNESMKYWDTGNMERMAHREARTPGLLSPDDNPLSRKESIVSQLSSEISSKNGDSDVSPAEEEVCRSCGSREFRLVVTPRLSRKSGAGGNTTLKRLVCSKCGKPV